MNLLIHRCVGDYDDKEEMRLNQLTLDEADNVIYADSDEDDASKNY